MGISVGGGPNSVRYFVPKNKNLGIGVGGLDQFRSFLPKGVPIPPSGPSSRQNRHYADNFGNYNGSIH